jgi:hypothetical protein
MFDFGTAQRKAIEDNRKQVDLGLQRLVDDNPDNQHVLLKIRQFALDFVLWQPPDPQQRQNISSRERAAQVVQAINLAAMCFPLVDELRRVFGRDNRLATTPGHRIAALLTLIDKLVDDLNIVVSVAPVMLEKSKVSEETMLEISKVSANTMQIAFIYTPSVIRDDGAARSKGESKLSITIKYGKRVCEYVYRSLPQDVLEGFISIPVGDTAQKIAYFELFIKTYPNRAYNPPGSACD